MILMHAFPLFPAVQSGPSISLKWIHLGVFTYKMPNEIILNSALRDCYN